MSRVKRGRVHEFDPDVGLGIVRGDDGENYRFHCIEIVDGTRDISVDTEIWFVVRHRFGVSEAAGLVRR